MLEWQSAVASGLAATGRDGADSRRRVTLGEATGWTLTQIAAFSGTLPAFETKVHAMLDMAVQGRTHGVLVFFPTPEQVWIAASVKDDVEYQILELFEPDVGAVTLLTESRVVITLEGEAAVPTLSKLVPLDLHCRSFPPGQAAATSIDHGPTLLHRLTPERFNLYVMRSLALSVWERMADASLEFGYDVAASAHRIDLPPGGVTTLISRTLR